MSRALLEFVGSRAEANPGTEMGRVYYERLLCVMRETVKDYAAALGDVEELSSEAAGMLSGEDRADMVARARALEHVCMRLAAVFRDDREFKPEWRHDRPLTMQGIVRMQFLTVEELAAIMRVSKMTVYRLVHSGEIESVRVGRSFRIPGPALSNYLRGCFIGPEELRRLAEEFPVRA